MLEEVKKVTTTFCLMLFTLLASGQTDEFLVGFEKVDSLLNNLNYEFADKELDRLSKVTNFSIPENEILWCIYSEKSYTRQKELIKSFEVLERGLELARKNNLVHFLPRLFFSIGVTYKRLGDKEKSIDYIRMAEKECIRQNDSVTRTLINFSKANLLGEKLAIPEYSKVVDFFKHFDSEYIGIIISARFNMALCFKEFDLTTASTHFDTIIDISKQYGRRVPLCNAYSNKAEIFWMLGKLDSSIVYFNKSNEEGLPINDIEVLSKNYDFLSQIFNQKQDFGNAYHCLRTHKRYNDKVSDRITKGKEKISSYLSMLKDKKKEVEVLKREERRTNKLNRTNTLLLISVFSLLLLFITLLFLLAKRKNEKKETDLLLKNTRLKTKYLESKSMQRERELNASISGYQSAQKFIAKELHDQIANSLAALKMKIGSIDLRENIGGGQLENLSETVESIYLQIRSLSHSLDTPDAEFQNFMDLIENIVLDFATNNGIDVEWSIHPKEEFVNLEREVKAELFLILRELFINTYKHAEAKKITMNINLYEDELILIYSDDGMGFNPNVDSQGVGLLNLKLRVEKLIGEVEIISNENKGSTFNITIPKN